MAQKQLLPFRAGTRRRFQKIGSLAYAANSTVSLQLPRVGYLARLIVQFVASDVAFSSAGALANLGPWSLVSRFRVTTNIGSASLIDVSGYGAYMAQQMQRFGWRPNNGGMGDTAIGADIYSFPVDDNTTARLSYVLPISANMGPNFETGLINLQAPETQVNIEIQTGAVTDAATNITAITGVFNVYYEYFEIPPLDQFMQPPLAIVRTLEDQQPVSQTLENIYTVPRMGTLLQLAHRLTLNGARSDSWDYAKVMFNKTDSIVTIDRGAQRVMERELYGLDYEVGVMHHDFFSAYDNVGSGDTRDAIDSEELTTLESIIAVSSGATLGSNNNFLASVRRVVQMLEA